MHFSCKKVSLGLTHLESYLINLLSEVENLLKNERFLPLRLICEVLIEDTIKQLNSAPDSFSALMNKYVKEDGIPVLCSCFSRYAYIIKLSASYTEDIFPG